MTRKEQQQIVEILTNSVRDEIIGKIKDKKVPEDWDGIEFRQLLADKFANEFINLSYFRVRKSNYDYAVYNNNL